jgi:hypothetical protein
MAAKKKRSSTKKYGGGEGVRRSRIPSMTTAALYRCPKGHVVDENPCPTHRCPTEPY